jgi:Bacterial protein of unknown function (DUF885)
MRMNTLNRFAWAGLVAAALVAAGCDAQAPQVSAAANEPLNPQFEQLIDRYLKEVRGVGGGLAGDMSAQSFDQRIAAEKVVLKDLAAIDRKALSFDQDIDYRFLQGILESGIKEGEQVHRWRQDPRVYVETNPITFRLQADPRDPEERGAALVRDMKNQQAKIANAKINLTAYMARWLPYANARIDGTILHFQTAVPEFAARLSPGLKTELLAETDKAIASLRDFRTWVNTEWPKKPAGDFRYGPDLFNYLQEHRHMLDGNDRTLRTVARAPADFARVPNYYDWGWKQYRLVESQLVARARDIDPKRTWLQIVRDMKRAHPAAEQLVYNGLKIARKTREWTIKNDLVSIPWKDDDQIMVWSDPSMSASQWWGFGPGFLPTAHTSKKMAWPIIPIDPDWPDDVAEENLTEKDDSFTYAIAPHEAYPGHHLMRLYRNLNPRKLRVYESSYSDQAWCYYVEWELAPDPDYAWYPPAKQELYSLEALRLKLWRMGRVIIDAGLHSGKLTWDQAVDVESNRTGFVKRGAEINIDGISASATGTAAPTVGYFQWMALRDEYFNKMRELDQKGTLKDFHDRIYKIGFLPVTLVREALLHELEREYRKPRPRTT